MVEHLGDEFEFRIVTRDRDALDTKPYKGVKVDDWNSVGKAKVFYASSRTIGLWGVARLLRQTPHDVLYLNSFFSYGFTALPLMARRMGMAPKKPCVIAPRGEFSVGALALKSWKKRPYLKTVRALGLYSGLTWQASSLYEKEDIEEKCGSLTCRIIVASNLPPSVKGSAQDHLTPELHKGPLRVVFLSRITPMKNLDFALRTIKKVRPQLVFNIYGPIRDGAYWHRCKELIEALPENIAVEYCGSVTPDSVSGIMAQHDLFFLPTLGENYGHVIPEALCAGTPVLIADTTPWRHLAEAAVGWDLPLQAGENVFAERIEEVARMPVEVRSDWRMRIAKWAASKLSDTDVIEANRNLFVCAAEAKFHF